MASGKQYLNFSLGLAGGVLATLVPLVAVHYPAMYMENLPLIASQLVVAAATNLLLAIVAVLAEQGSDLFLGQAVGIACVPTATYVIPNAVQLLTYKVASAVYSTVHQLTPM